MKGNWVTSGLRRLNKHYQSEQKTSEKIWTGDFDLCPVDCIFAPSYCLFDSSGDFIKWIDLSSLTFSPSIVENVDICKMDIYVSPYIPKIEDNWFLWGDESSDQRELSWHTGNEECKIWYKERSNLIETINTNIQPVPANTDLSSYKLPLIVPECDFYLLRSNTSSANLSALFDSLGGGKCKYNFATYEDNIMDNKRFLTGSFGNENINTYYNVNATPYQLGYFDNSISSRYLPGKNWNYVYIQGALPISPGSETSWSGRQTVTAIFSGSISASSADVLPGVKYTYPTYMQQPKAGDYTGYYFGVMWILKSLRKEERTITG